MPSTLSTKLALRGLKLEFPLQATTAANKPPVRNQDIAEISRNVMAGNLVELKIPDNFFLDPVSYCYHRISGS